MGEYVVMKVYQSALNENDALREQNRVLREALQEIASDVRGNPKRKQMIADDDFWAAPGEHTLRQWIAKAALTATSQPAKSAGKMHACDVPGCVSCGNPEDATSQERSVNKEG